MTGVIIQPMQRTTLAVLLGFALVYAASAFVFSLMEPDEGRYLTIPYEMAESGDFVLPTLNGVPYPDKPPLQYWVTAGLMAAFGPHVWVGRVFPTACTLFAALLLFLFVRRESDEDRGLLAAAVFLGSLYTLGVGRLNTLDAAFGAFVAWALFEARRYLQGEGGRHLYLGWGALLLGFFTKGLAAPVLVGGALLVWSALSRRPFRWLDLVRPLPLAVFAAAAMGWLWLLERSFPGAAWFFVVHEHFARFTTEAHHHGAPWYYFLLVLAGGLMPWTLRVPWLKPRNGDAALFLASWAGFVLLFFSMSSSKLPTYLTPMWPAACGLFALWFAEARGTAARAAAAGGAFLLAAAMAAVPFHLVERYGAAVVGDGGLPLSLLAAGIAAAAGFREMRRASGAGGIVGTALMVALALAVFSAPFGEAMDRLKGSEGIARVLEREARAGDRPARYKSELQGLPFLLRKRVAVLGSPGELAFGVERLAPEERSRWFPTKAEYRRAVREGERFLVVMRRKRIEEFEREWGPAQLVGSWGRFVVMRSVPPREERKGR